ncbi:MAG: hypothetical protein DDT34_01771 [Firmicutes bacterium]|nr:hypothetical protein [Bacillota bacterium]
MNSHDPIRFLGTLSSKLAARSRHISVLLGAGSSRACGLPDIGQLRARILEKLEPPLRAKFQAQVDGRSIEQALSRIRRIRSVVSGEQVIDGLNLEGANELDLAICQRIVAELDVAVANLIPVRQFAVWAGRSSFSMPIEVFTVNYDLLLETAFDKHRVTYFDGFVGTLRAQFQTELVENIPGPDTDTVPSFFVRLWKLHGSVNWAWEDGKKVVRLGAPVDSGSPAAIYPSELKYEESRRVPFLVLQDRLRRALNQPESLTLICGYSFSDEHLNELIFDAAERRERSEVVVLCYDDIPDQLAERALTTPNLQVVGRKEGVLSGERRPWKFSADAPKEFCSSDQFLLPDFAVFSMFLAKSSGYLHEKDPLLKDLIASIQAVAGEAQ